MTIRLATPAPEAYLQPLLIHHILYGAITAHADQQIVYRSHHRQTYSDLFKRVHRLANVLASLGVDEGHTVAFMDWDSHRYLEAYFAVPMMGAVLQTVNVRLPQEQLIWCLQDAKASVLVVHRDFLTLVNAIAPHLPDLRRCIVIADGEAFSGQNDVGEYETMLAASGTKFDFREFNENAIATTFHTTGTTGHPKPVSFTHRQLVLHTLALATTLAAQPDNQGLRRNDVYMPLTPMFHVHAWGVPFVATMLGIKQVFPGRYDPALMLKLRRDENVSFSHCVPTVLQMILAAARSEQASDLAPWTMLIGGSALTRALRQQAADFGIDTLAGYGMSETGPAIAIARNVEEHPDKLDAALRRAGWPLPLVQVDIVDPEMNSLPHDGRSQGELVLRAPWLTQSYGTDAAANKALWLGGWMHTQDLASIDLRGTLTLRDRMKDVIKSGGEWVSSVQLEELIVSHEGVAEAAVIAVEDEKWGERPLAYVVPKVEFSGNVTSDAIQQHLTAFVENGTISRIAVPHDIRVVESLPKTSVGKVDKKALQKNTLASARPDRHVVVNPSRTLR
ncbi:MULTISPECIES: long-chain-fatty-acid--CoA ligase [Burkholderiaceae]|uniref:long-chain-fatty-acid--CoA ligase n=1 Tax=Burkholderiaceae TaxID=119060 RepID=UPI001422CF97|nr:MULTISPECIES: long-chain-fatty-acid--CoA ligase [Burkholderiaceae]MBN3848860.1 long-chain-fatty-acid--CoA ligase [Paraburkholderia sp. Ac-20342]NIF50937.1 long-chain-fatty-acid--CoA ligase [Burkholderia sp. Ax-1724]